MAKSVVRSATPKVKANLKNRFSGSGRNPQNPRSGATLKGPVNAVTAANPGKGIAQSSVAANLTRNSSRGTTKLNHSPIVGSTPRSAKPGNLHNSVGSGDVKRIRKAANQGIPSTVGGGFKNFIGGK